MAIPLVDKTNTPGDPSGVAEISDLKRDNAALDRFIQSTSPNMP
jgi:hypothetical protein